MTPDQTLRGRIRETLDLLLPLAQGWAESPEGVGTPAAMALAFFLPTVQGWRERIEDLDIGQTRAVVEAARELLAWSTDADDNRGADELAADVLARLSGSGLARGADELAAAELASPAGE